MSFIDIGTYTFTDIRASNTFTGEDTMERYEIIAAEDRYELQKKVNDAIEQCEMIPIGGVSVVPHNVFGTQILLQAMIRKGI